MWERMSLTEATAIIFWIPRQIPEMMGFTTNVEFGYWLHSGKVLYGRPENTPKTKYLDWLYELDFNMKPYNNLEELLDKAVKAVNEKLNN